MAADERPPPRPRRPRSVYGVGDEPDARFSLANERTALAWVRTALAMIAGGIALTSFAATVDLPLLLHLVAVAASVAGGVLAVAALISWQRTERALRRREPLPPPVILRWLVVSVVLLAAVLAVFAVRQSLS